MKSEHQRSALLRHKRLLALPVFGLLMVAALWSATLLQLAANERAATEGALRDTEVFVTAFEQYTRQRIKNADRTVLLVKREFERHGVLNLHELADVGLVDTENFVRVSVIDSTGRIVASSRPANDAANVAEREYFRMHQAGDTGRLDISKPVVDRSTERTLIHFTRRINHRDGSFAGIVAVSVAPDYFTEFYVESDLGKRGTLGVHSLDGNFRVRRVGHETASVPETANTSFLARVRANPAGSYEGVAASDQVARIFAYRKLGDYPLAVVASQAKGEVLGDLHRSRSGYFAAASLATLVIVAFFAVVTGLARRLQRYGADVLAQRQFLDTLVDNMPDGVEVRSMRAGDPGQFVIWNKAMAALFGARTGQALGRTVVEIMPPKTAARILDLDRQLLATPALQEEVEAAEVPGRGRRMIRRVRTPILGVNDEIEYVLSISSDVTDAQARADEIRLASKVFETTADGIILTDCEDRVIGINTAFSRLTGYGSEEMLGKRLSESPFRPTDIAESDARMERLHRDGFVTGEVPRQSKDGKPLALWVTATCVRDSAGVIVNYVRVFTDISPLKESQRKLEQLASFDAVTGLPNRHLLQDRLVQALRRTSRHGGRMGVMFIDLDQFKDVNDMLGHDVGDQLLKDVADRLQECVRASDSVCRFGGDEFVILLEPLNTAADAVAVGQRIVAALAPPFLVAGHRIRTTASIGIALNPQDGTDAATLLKHADVAMYRSKERGRNRFEFYTVPAEDATAA